MADPVLHVRVEHETLPFLVRRLIPSTPLIQGLTLNLLKTTG